MEPRKIDRFSKLPPELIDSIFEIAVSRDKSSTIAPSKALSTSHARALYRRIHISEHHQLEKLAASLVANPNNGLHVRSIVWCDNMLYEGGDKRVRLELLRQILEKLPNLDEMKFDYGTDIAQLIIMAPQFSAFVTPMKVCRFDGLDIPYPLVGWLQQNPNLRRVELIHVDLYEEEDEEGDEEEDEEEEYTLSASQVMQVAIGAPGERIVQEPRSLGRFVKLFPSAQVVSLSMGIFSSDTVDDMNTFLARIAPGLQSLELHGFEFNEPPQFDHLLPLFLHLRHLHLGQDLFSPNINDQLPSLRNLVSLSLTLSEFFPTFDPFVAALRQLPRLRDVKLEYSGSSRGDKFDITDAQAQIDNDVFDEMERFLDISNLEDMSSTRWNTPFSLNFGNQLDALLELEERSKELGITFRSNLREIVRNLYRQLIEFHNRGIARIWFYSDAKLLRYSRALASDPHINFTLPRLDIDLDDLDSLSKNNLRWHKEWIFDKLGGGREGCFAYNLRYQGERGKGRKYLTARRGRWSKVQK